MIFLGVVLVDVSEEAAIDGEGLVAQRALVAVLAL
jgi:hypothetical protein